MNIGTLFKAVQNKITVFPGRKPLIIELEATSLYPFITPIMPRKIYAALIHYPVVDKSGSLVSTSVTNLDIHDISRSARTYGLDGYFIVTPVEAQHWLVSKILSHWDTGWGASYNENRKEALSRTTCVTDIGQLIDVLQGEGQEAPIFVVTSARKYPNSQTFEQVRNLMKTEGPPVVILFGTGWGLHPELVMEAEIVLEPIPGTGNFNHLSVRAAAAIIFDRLLGYN